MKDREKEFIRIQEKNDHYLIYVAVGGLYMSFFAYEKVCNHFLKLYFILGFVFFILSILLFLISRHFSKEVAEEEARTENEKDITKIDKINCNIVFIDELNLLLVFAGCILSSIYFIVNLI